MIKMPNAIMSGSTRKKLGKLVLILMLVLAVVTVLVLEVFSRGAAMIFNQAMQDQDVLRGSITVEKLLADITGHVIFENLEWKDRDGNTLLKVPSGSFQARPWDVVMHQLKSTTIQELTLNNAEVSVHLAEDMQVDFIRPSRDMDNLKKQEDEGDNDWRNKVSLAGKTEEERKAIGQWRRQHKADKLKKRWTNFNRAGRKIRMKLNFNNCRMEVFYKDRHYLMDHVDIRTDINTADTMTLHASTGGFGGTMIGNGVKIDGTVDFQAESVPACDMRVRLIEVDPSSLGFGMDVHDKMMLNAHLQGPVNDFSGDGNLQMDELHIPGLDFTDVLGDIHYDGSTLTFSNVTAGVYGGILSAYGDYDLDTRYYHLYGTGKNLSTAAALPGSHLSCLVDMDLMIESRGNARETTIKGSFESGPGRYRILPFNRLAGQFSNEYHDLQFYNAVIELAGVTANTDAFRIKDGKLTMRPLRLTDKEGRLLTTYDPAK
ncbi:MAG: hypothetical protein KBI24_00210 [Selenomonas sp.]|nr:hypothetical protein [Selenomonas sp.]